MDLILIPVRRGGASVAVRLTTSPPPMERHLAFKIQTYDERATRTHWRSSRSHQKFGHGCWDIAFNIFQNSARPPSWIFFNLIFEQLQLWITNRCHCAKLHQNWPNGFGDIVIFFIFKTAAIWHLVFLSFWFFWKACRIRRANMRQHAKFRRNRWNRCWDIAIYSFFQDGSHSPFSIWVTNSGTTLNDNLVVFIIVQDLVGITLVVLIMQYPLPTRHPLGAVGASILATAAPLASRPPKRTFRICPCRVYSLLEVSRTQHTQFLITTMPNSVAA